MLALVLRTTMVSVTATVSVSLPGLCLWPVPVLVQELAVLVPVVALAEAEEGLAMVVVVVAMLSSRQMPCLLACVLVALPSRLHTWSLRCSRMRCLLCRARYPRRDRAMQSFGSDRRRHHGRARFQGQEHDHDHDHDLDYDRERHWLTNQDCHDHHAGCVAGSGRA